MKYMIIEKWEILPCPYVLADEDGIVMLFDSEKEANVVSSESCHDGIVVPY